MFQLSRHGTSPRPLRGGNRATPRLKFRLRMTIRMVSHHGGGDFMRQGWRELTLLCFDEAREIFFLVVADGAGGANQQKTVRRRAWWAFYSLFCFTRLCDVMCASVLNCRKDATSLDGAGFRREACCSGLGCNRPVLSARSSKETVRRRAWWAFYSRFCFT
jgi:hypothetical protein